jgi:hypothetical protein
LNLYTYTTNNPLRYIDPTGHDNLGLGFKDYSAYKSYKENYNSKLIDPNCIDGCRAGVNIVGNAFIGCAICKLFDAMIDTESQGKAVLDFLWLDSIDALADPNTSNAGMIMAIITLIPGGGSVLKEGKFALEEAQAAAKVFEESISKLAWTDRIGVTKGVLSEIAKNNGWKKESKLTKWNNREVYGDADGNFWAFDTQHGRYEKTDRFGSHGV